MKARSSCIVHGKMHAPGIIAHHADNACARGLTFIKAIRAERKIYKQHYACFSCCKAFKKTNLLEAPKQRVRIDEAGRIVVCPQCGARMSEVGFDFEPPKKNDDKAWEEAKARVMGTLDYAISNSSLVKSQSRKKRKKFIAADDKKRDRRDK